MKTVYVLISDGRHNFDNGIVVRRMVGVFATREEAADAAVKFVTPVISWNTATDVHKTEIGLHVTLEIHETASYEPGEFKV